MPNNFPFGQRGVPIVLICVILYLTTVKGLQFASVSHELPSGEFSIDSKNYASPGLFYGTCKKNHYAGNYYDCTLAMETKSRVGSLDHLRFCNFTVRGYNDFTHFSVIAIDEDKAILSKNDKTSGSISILHFSNCREVSADLDNTKFISVNPASNDIFDVVSSSEYGTVRLVLDFKGHIVSQSQGNLLSSSAVTVQSSLKWRLGVARVADYHLKDAIHITAVNYDGTEEVLKSYPLDEEYSEYAISPTHDLLSVCTKKDSSVFCGQFDLNGGLEFELDFTLAKSSSSYFLNCYNLPGGGLIVLLLKCSHDDPYSPHGYCPMKADAYYIIKKYDFRGHHVGSLKTRQLSRDGMSPVSKIHFFQNEMKEMCLSSVSLRKQPPNNDQVTLDVFCFKDEDLFL